jgi:hypothetical protein
MEEDMTHTPQLPAHGAEKVEKQTHALQQAISVEQGHGTSEDLGRFHRSFTPRQVHARNPSKTSSFCDWTPD